MVLLNYAYGDINLNNLFHGQQGSKFLTSSTLVASFSSFIYISPKLLNMHHNLKFYRY